MSSKNKNAIVTIMTGVDPSYAYALKSFKHYGQKVGADVIVLHREAKSFKGLRCFDFSKKAWAQKFLLPKFLQDYERVLYLDADIVVHPHAPDLFATYSDPQKIYMFNEGRIEDRAQEWDLIHQLNGAREAFYYNAGVILFSRESRFLLEVEEKAVEFFLQRSKYYEQTYFNFYIAKHKLAHQSIDEKFNRMIISGAKEKRFEAFFIHHAGGAYSNRSKFRFLTLIEDYCLLYQHKLSWKEKGQIFFSALGFYLRRQLKKKFAS